MLQLTLQVPLHRCNKENSGEIYGCSEFLIKSSTLHGECATAPSQPWWTFNTGISLFWILVKLVKQSMKMNSMRFGPVRSLRRCGALSTSPSKLPRYKCPASRIYWSTLCKPTMITGRRFLSLWHGFCGIVATLQEWGILPSHCTRSPNWQEISSRSSLMLKNPPKQILSLLWSSSFSNGAHLTLTFSRPISMQRCLSRKTWPV